MQHLEGYLRISAIDNYALTAFADAALQKAFILPGPYALFERIASIAKKSCHIVDQLYF